MNTKGHPQTLVPAHPGNRNAVKSGVFSPATVAPRVHDLEQAIADRPAAEVLADLLRRELAALAALGEAMDRSLSIDGLHGRSGDPRTLISLRLRLNEKFRRTIEQYARTVAPELAEGTEQDRPPQPGPLVPNRNLESLIETIADDHNRSSINDISPAELDPDIFLVSVISSSDPEVNTQDRLRARRMLTKRQRKRPPTCLCFSTLAARNELELREWIDEARKGGVKPHAHDASIAELVRRIARGRGVPDFLIVGETRAAINQVVTESANRALGDGSDEDETYHDDPASALFWQIALSPDPRTSAKERLEAFSALDECGALPQCRCKPKRYEFVEHEVDAWYGYVIRIVAQKHYSAALRIAEYPETFLAVQSAIDSRVVGRLEADVLESVTPAQAS